jgi:inosose dehydratase
MKEMKIGYGTYGMPEVPVWDALPRLAAMGYEAVEICVADRWPTAPRKLAPEDRRRLRDLVATQGLELTALMVFVNMLAAEGEELDQQLGLWADACALARELAPAAPPVVVSTLGHRPLPWEEVLPLVAERVAAFAAEANQQGCRLALEPHSGGLLDRPERVVEAVEQARAALGPRQAPALGINFDISHFAAVGIPRAETIRTLAPYAFSTHVKDGYLADGKVVFQLPGEGDFDYPAYFREMAQAGWSGPITVEVSAQIFNRPGYDPWPAARFCRERLRRARALGLGLDA